MTIDAEDAPIFDGYRLACTHCGEKIYADARVWRNGKWIHYRAHRMILNAPKGVDVDHINGDTLDNRKINLRLCTTAQNSMNTRKARAVKGKPCRSRFKGVYKATSGQRWGARIKIAGRYRHLGCFASEGDAAKAYNTAAREFFGQFARLNEVPK